MVAGDDGGDGMQCGDHPYRSNPGGICAFCLQEKLGKLVNSTKTSTTFYPVPPPTHHSSPSPPSLRTSAAVAAKTHITTTVKNDGSPANKARRSSRLRIPFFYYGSSRGHMKRRKKKSSVGSTTATTKPATAKSTTSGSGFVLKRSKSVATRVTAPGFSEGDPTAIVDSPRKRWFWSFLHFSSDSTGDLKHKHQHQQFQEDHQPHQQNKASETPILKPNSISSSSTTTREEQPNTPKKDQAVAAVVDEAESPSGSQAPSSFGRKVARSRSVGCGSRSFSGDFLERISTGFGDCALRRVESQRDPKPKNGEEEMESKRQQRVRCGGIFGGFGMISSSSYWLPVEFSGCAGRISGGGGGGGIPHCRGKGWGWAFASPIRAFRPSSSKSSNTTTLTTTTTTTTTTTVII